MRRIYKVGSAIALVHAYHHFDWSLGALVFSVIGLIVFNQFLIEKNII